MNGDGNFATLDQLSETEIAEALFGAVLFDPASLHLAGHLRPDDLHKPLHQAIWATIRECNADRALVIERLPGELELILQLSDKAGNPTQVGAYAQRLIAASVRRKMGVIADQRLGGEDLRAALEEGAARLKPQAIGRPDSVFQASEFAGRPYPPRIWHVPDLMPAKAVTMMSADGAGGKTTLGLQLSAATVLGGEWLGLTVRQGSVIYFSAEEDRDELQRRLDAIGLFYDARWEDLSGLRLWDMTEEDALLAQLGARGALEPTPLFDRLAADVAATRPALVVIDTLNDTFGGNEISRVHARQYVGMLRKLAAIDGAAVLLISHPSLLGMSSGSGASGSTAWSNSVRSRLYLTKPEDAEADPDARLLKLMKANYAPPRADMKVRRTAGAYVLDGVSVRLTPPMVEAVFLELLAAYTEQKRPVTDKPGPTYAPALFAEEPAAVGADKKTLTAAMNRLLMSKRVRVETWGPTSKERTRLVIAGDE